MGYYFVWPEEGKLACGYKGIGRLANIEKIRNIVEGLINKKDLLKGKKIIVTAGGTVEEIDPVRAIKTKVHMGIDGLIHHSDQGVQYACNEYVNRLRS